VPPSKNGTLGWWNRDFEAGAKNKTEQKLKKRNKGLLMILSNRIFGARLGALLLLLMPLLALIFVLQPTIGRAETLTFAAESDWDTWVFPRDLVQFDAEEGLSLRDFRRDINATLNAADFVHPTQKRGPVSGGIWNARSSPGTANNLIDGDLQTTWRPRQADESVDWLVDIDLGRVVLAKSIRVTFAPGRALSQFRVFTATGGRVKVDDDIFKYDLAFRTTRPNDLAFIDIPLSGLIDTTRAVEDGLGLDLASESGHRAIQYVRLVADEKTAGAAVAEIEVIAAGDNLSLGVIERGGSFANGQLARDINKMFDGNMDTFAFLNSRNKGFSWREVGVWWEVDLGALFFVDNMYLYFRERGEGLSSFLFEGQNIGQGYEFLASQGQRTISGAIDYDRLMIQPAAVSPREGVQRRFRFFFRPRKIRHILWHGLNDSGWSVDLMEMMLFSPGHPAQVEMRSDFIDVGLAAGDGRPKAIKTLEWDAELPPGTRLQLRSRSGSHLRPVFTFHDRAGQVLTQAQWNSKPKVLRGPIDTTIVVGEDWGGWSNFYQVPGERFKSDTPRRFVQLEVILATEDPRVAPRLKRLSLDFEDALVEGASGGVTPQQARPDVETRFTYRIRPEAGTESGFDRVRLRGKGLVAAAGVEVVIDGRGITPRQIEVTGDSLLLVDLPARVTEDSLAIAFTARLLRNATLFEAELGQRGREGIWQSVEAAEPQANVVLLPELASRKNLIGGLELKPAVFSPNGDGINDALEIRFTVFKAETAQPVVEIIDLAGRTVAALELSLIEGRWQATWDGRDGGGQASAPGLYLCRVEAGTQTSNNEVLRVVAVGY
jgi:hypothetical protein